MPNEKILIVDDDFHILTLLTHVLESDGYAVRAARNGVEALKSLQTDAPDLVILDVNMPQVDGWNVLSAMRSADTTKMIPVLMCTNKDMVGDVERAELLGATDYLPKPFQVDRLLILVRRLLENPKS